MCLAVLLVTLRPGGGGGSLPCSFWSLACGSEAGVDLVLNLALFFPLGFALALAGGRRGLAPYLLPAALSLGIELAQMIPALQRDPSLRDVLSNGLGGAAGVWLGRHLARLRAPDPTTARRLMAGWALLLAAVLIMGGLGLGISIPPSRWFGQWAPELGQFARYRGVVLGAQLSGQPFPPGGSDRRIQALAAREGYRLSVRTVPADDRPGRTAPVASVFDDAQRQIVVLGRRGDDAVFMARRRAEDWGFQAVAIRAPLAFAGAAGDTLRFEATLFEGAGEVAWQSASGRGGALAFRLGPLDAWRLGWLWPVALRPGAATLIAAFLLGAVLAPLGYWNSRAAPGPAPWATGIALALLPFAIAVWPTLLGLRPASAAVWVGGLAGWMAGFCVGRATNAVVRSIHE